MVSLKPNLFLVGFPKSGTTSLHFMLKQHPKIFMSTPKEPEFFCFDLKEESDKFHKSTRFFAYRSIEEYMSIFKNVPKNAIFVGESSTIYIYSRVAAKEIYQFNPESKVIISLREPLSFLRSFHRQLLFSEDEKIKDLERALYAEKFRKLGYLIPDTTNFPSILFYSEWIKYWKHIKRFIKYFGARNIYFMIYEEFKRDNTSEFRKVLTKFLKLKPIKTKQMLLNPSKEQRIKLLNRVIKKLPWPIKKAGKEIFHRYLFEAYFKLSRKIVRKKKDKADEKLYTKLRKKFKKHVKKTSEVININLMEKWGYADV